YQVRAKRTLDLSSETSDQVRTGMINVVNGAGGTAHQASLDDVEVAGKTGTAQWGPKNKERTAAWFAGFLPADQPRYAFAAVYEGDVGSKVHGGSAAAPMIADVFKDIYHVIAGQRRTFWRLGEFNELFFVVNVRQGRRHAIVREQPLQCRLPYRALRIFKESQLLNLFNPVEQPTARTMAAMIGRRKRGLRSVFSFEHSGRMRHTNQKHCIFARIGRGLVKGTPGMLLQHVVDVLHAGGVAL